MSSIFKIDTKGSCLLCLSPSSTVKDFDSKIAFKMLLRYLKVDWLKLLTPSNSGSNDVVGIWNFANLSVSLCEECSSVATDFLELFQAFENIRMQLDVCVGQLHEFMVKGDNDSDLVEEFERRVNNGNSKDMMSASMAQKLRKETMEKAFQKVTSSLPRISLQSSSTSRHAVEYPICSESPAPQLVEKVEVTENTSYQNQCELQPEIYFSPSIPPRNESHGLPVEDYSILPGNPTEQTEPSEIPNVVKCNYCELRVLNITPHFLEIHQYNKHAKAILTDKGFLPPSISEQQLEAALKNISGKGEPKHRVQCLICKISFKRKFPLRKHLLQNHLPQVIEETKKFPEDVRVQANNNSLQSHLRKRLNRCSTCGEYFHNISTLFIHKLRKHPTNVLMDTPLPGSPSEQDVRIGDVKRTPERKYDPNSSVLSTFSSSLPRYKCNHCMKTTQTAVGLKQHYIIKHKMRTVGSRYLKCDHCQATFSGEHTLKVHLSLTHPEITYSSLLPPGTSHKDFNKALGWITNRIRGNTMEGSVFSVRILECPHCQHKMKQKTQLKLHIIRVHLEKVVETIQRMRSYDFEMWDNER